MTREELAEEIAYCTSIGHWSADGLAAYVMEKLHLKWQPIETAPKGEHILLYGVPEDGQTVTYRGPMVLSGYYDTLDEAWCSTTSEWSGPFIAPTHWMPLPEGPK